MHPASSPRPEPSEGRPPCRQGWRGALFWRLLGGLLGCSLLAAGVSAGPVLQRVQAAGEVRVCIWPDYYGVTLRHPRTGQLQGIDIDLSFELGRDLRLRVRHVDSSFATLIEDLRADRCDVAMFAIGMLPQRMEALRFTRPYLQSSIYAITSKGSPVVRRWEDIDQPGVAVAVQLGTFMEPVMAAALRHARLVRSRRRPRVSASWKQGGSTYS